MAENKENESSAEFQLRLAHHLPRPYASGVKTSLPIRADQPLSRREQRVVVRATERALTMRLNALLSESAQSLSIHLGEHSSWKFSEITDYRREILEQERHPEDQQNIVNFSGVISQLSADALIGIYKQAVANMARPLSEPLTDQDQPSLLRALVSWIDSQ